MSTQGRAFADRYSLDVQISTATGTPVWRALDQVLKRWVTVYLVPRSDPSSPLVITECLRVAAHNTPGTVAILDVIEQGKITGIPTVSTAEDYLGVVTEWVEGETLDRRLLRTGEALLPERALELTSSIAEILDTAHKAGIPHGRLRPHNIVLREEGAVRVSGIGIERAILGADRSNGVQADVMSLGNVLFAMCTGKWPDGSADGLPSAGTQVPLPVPSQIVDGLPLEIDRFFTATQDGTILSARDAVDMLSSGKAPERDRDATSAGEAVSVIADAMESPTAKPPKTPSTPAVKKWKPTTAATGQATAVATGIAALKAKVSGAAASAVAKRSASALKLDKVSALRSRFARSPKPTHETTSITDTSPIAATAARAASSVATTVFTTPKIEWAGEPNTENARLRAMLIALGATVLFGWIGWRLLTMGTQGPAEPMTPESPVATASVSASASPSMSASPLPPLGPAIAIKSVSTFDPKGDQSENPTKASLAIDGKIKTFWPTSSYSSANAGGKGGVGLIIDLGSQHDITGVTMSFYAPSHGVSIYVGNSSKPSLAKSALLGSVRSASINQVIRATAPMRGRYVLIWLTKLPALNTTHFMGGISEVSVS